MNAFIELTKATENGDRVLVNISKVVSISAGANGTTTYIDLGPIDSVYVKETYEQVRKKLLDLAKVI